METQNNEEISMEPIHDANIDLDLDVDVDDYIDFHLRDDDDDDGGGDQDIGVPSLSSVHGECVTCTKMCELLTQMKDYICLKNNNGLDIEHVVVFPAYILNFWKLKSEIRKYRDQPVYKSKNIPSYCQCVKRPYFHRETGKCGVIILALSFAYHVSRTAAVASDVDDIIMHMEGNYGNWKAYIKRKKPSTHKAVTEKKIARYEKILNYNRQMYRLRAV